MDAIYDLIFSKFTRIGQRSWEVLLFRWKLLLFVYTAKKWGILGIQNRLSVLRRDGEAEAFDQDRFLQPRVQTSNGDLFLQTYELYWLSGLLRWRVIFNVFSAEVWTYSGELSRFWLVFFIGVQTVLEFKFKDLLLALVHFLIQSFESGLQHRDGVSERLLSLLEILFDQDSSDYFPTFPGPR